MKAVSMTGNWANARAQLKNSEQRLAKAITRALHQEAELLRKMIVQGVTQQAPGGKRIRPLAKTTLATRRWRGFGGTKALIVRADLRNSVSVIVRGEQAFVGVARTARSRDGRSLVDIARVQEFGSSPRVIPMTAPMRRFLFAMLREAGVAPRAGSGRGVVVVQTPARPFLRPAFEQFRRGVRERFMARVKALSGLGGK